jgi:hypothetical protein
MGRFVKRQAKTKTGKLAMGIILTSAAASLSGEMSFGDAVQSQAVSLLAMFLRDKAAKREAQDRGDE